MVILAIGLPYLNYKLVTGCGILGQVQGQVQGYESTLINVLRGRKLC